MSWIEQTGEQQVILGETILLMLEQIKLLRQLLLKAERQLRVIMNSEKYKDQLNLLLSVPGIGPAIATLWLLEVGDVRRFGSFDQLNDFVGMCPDTADSGETERCRGITIRRHKQLRAALIEATWQAIRLDPALLESYQQLTKRMPGNRAIVRIARKLLRRIRAIQLTGVPYQKGMVA
jgi:transposase